MFRFKSIKCENFRGLSMALPIPMKRITLLVGRNSGGKSSFARLLPMLRQSVTAQRKSPVLWYGDLVDFGGFADVCNRNVPEGPIVFSFGLEVEESQDTHSGLRGNPKNFRLSPGLKVNASVSLKVHANNTYISEILLELHGKQMVLTASASGVLDSIRFGNAHWSREGTREEGFLPQGDLFPVPFFIEDEVVQVGDGDDDFDTVTRDVDPFFEPLIASIRGIVHGNTSETTIYTIASRLKIGPEEELAGQLEEVLMSVGVASQYLSSLSAYERGSLLSLIHDNLCLFRANNLLTEINQFCEDYFSGVRYLNPLRATAQRYYRHQELAVDEINPSGSNLVNVLTSLSWLQRNDLNALTERLFSFRVEVRNDGGHVSLFVKPTGAPVATNMADTGFGYSQLLPILVQVWMAGEESYSFAFSSRKSQKATALVVEQPELHLHPAYQAKLADLFSEVSGTFDDGMPLLIETHSSTLINRFGELIAQGKLDQNDIQVLLFTPDTARSCSEVDIAGFDEKGFLTNWPYGFFEPDVEL